VLSAFGFGLFTIVVLNSFSNNCNISDISDSCSNICSVFTNCVGFCLYCVLDFCCCCCYYLVES
jgi:purine-cytosine permease-like protein